MGHKKSAASSSDNPVSESKSDLNEYVIIPSSPSNKPAARSPTKPPVSAATFWAERDKRNQQANEFVAAKKLERERDAASRRDGFEIVPAGVVTTDENSSIVLKLS